MIGYKPLSITDLTTSSRMIVPPVNPSSDDIGSYAANTAVSRGAIIRNATTHAMYWAVAAGTTAAGGVAPTHTDGDVVDGTVTWRYLRPERTALTIVNLQATAISLALGNAAEVNKGIVLTGLGSVHEEGWNGGVCFQGAIYGIAASGSSLSVSVQEA